MSKKVSKKTGNEAKILEGKKFLKRVEKIDKYVVNVYEDLGLERSAIHFNVSKAKMKEGLALIEDKLFDESIAEVILEKVS